MVTVGVHELRQRASELIRMVRENGSEIQISYRGKVVALLMPVAHANQRVEAQAWAEIGCLAAEISDRWPAGLTAEKAVGDGR